MLHIAIIVETIRRDKGNDVETTPHTTRCADLLSWVFLCQHQEKPGDSITEPLPYRISSGVDLNPRKGDMIEKLLIALTESSVSGEYLSRNRKSYIRLLLLFLGSMTGQDMQVHPQFIDQAAYIIDWYANDARARSVVHSLVRNSSHAHKFQIVVDIMRRCADIAVIFS